MEYILIIVEFFYVKEWKATLWCIIPPLLIGVWVYFGANNELYIKNAPGFHTDMVTIQGIILGFTISTYAILLTANNSDIEKAKSVEIGKKLFSKNYTLYDSLLIGFSYIIIIQTILLIFNFIWPILIDITGTLGKVFFALNVSLMAHVILLIARNILDFYFIISRRG
jgi:hypothetical protein